MEREKILGGIPLNRFFPDRTNEVLVTVTELKDLLMIERYVAAARKAV
jgi:hypothetical protein